MRCAGCGEENREGRLRGDADGMARDLAEACRLFTQMGASGWDDYARSIEA